MKKSTFMRNHFRTAYEDPVYILIRRSSEGTEVNRERSNMQERFFEALKKNAPELLKMYDELIDSFLHFENVMFEEFYVLGVQDRDEVLMLQK